jgi:hypothetical protein
MDKEKDKDNYKTNYKTNYSYYIIRLIIVIIFFIFLFLAYKFRRDILFYISSLYRRFRNSSSFNMNLDPFRQGRINEQRQNLIEDIDRQFQDRNPEFQDRNPDFQDRNPDFQDMNPILQGGAAAIAAEGYVRNRARYIQGQENSTRREIEQEQLRRSGRIPNWTGPIAEREYTERRLKTARDMELEKQRAREDRARVTEITGGYTKDYLTKWITKQGWRQPNSKYIQDYWDLILGRTVPVVLSQPPRPEFSASSSSSPLVTADELEAMYNQAPNIQTSSLLYQPRPGTPGPVYKQVDFGRRKNKIYDLY